MKFCDVCHSTYPTEFSTCPKDQAPLRPATELMQGMVIRDKYEIVEKLGAGGMATVYRARHLVFNELRAIKVVSSRMMEDENFLKRFRNEAVITRKLQHPNAVRVDDIDTLEDGRPYIVMELVEGCDLRALIEQEGPLPVARALEITRQAAAALGAAHQLGITHRDIKPDNIVLIRQPDGKDVVKVLDFGIAKLREGAGEGAAYTATQTGMVIGTPQYISPEQAMGKRGEQIDGRADLYSLGIVLYQMLTARLPFESDTPMGLLLKHLQTPAPSPQEVRPDLNIPEPVSRLLLKCLEKDPANRFQSAEELIAALRQEGVGPAETRVIDAGAYPMPQLEPAATPTAAVTVRGPKAPTTAAPVPPGKPAARPVRAPEIPATSHSGLWIGAVAAILVVLVAGYFVIGRRTASSSANAPGNAVTQPVAVQPAAQTSPTPSAPAAATLPPATPDPAKAQEDRRARELVASGRRHVDNGEYDLAIKDLRQALQIAPDDAAARTELKRAEQAKRTEEQVLGRKH